MVVLPEADGPERPRIKGGRMVGGWVDEEEAGSKEEGNEGTALVDGVVPIINVGRWESQEVVGSRIDT